MHTAPSIRLVALSRKNALFAGSYDFAKNWAAVASLVEIRKLNPVDPQHYLDETLCRLVDGWCRSRIDELMSWLQPDEHTA